MKHPSLKKYAVVMYLATCLMWFSIYFYVPILSTYCEKMGANYTLVGTILSSYGLVQLIMRIPIGVFSDKINRRKVFMILGLMLSALSGLLFFFAKSVTMLLIGRSLSGFAAATWAIFMISYGSFYADDMQSKSMGVIGTTMFIGQVVATFFGGITATVASERLTFLISAFSALVGVLMVLMVKEQKNEQSNPLKAMDFISLLKNRDLLYFSMLAVIMQIAIFAGVLGFIPNMLKDMGADNFILGVSSAFATLLSIGTSLLSGSFFEEKLGLKKSIILSFMVISITLIMMAVAKSIWLILLLVLLSSAPRGVLQPMLNSLAIRAIKPQLRSSAASVFQSIYGIGMTVGPIITGVLADTFGITVSFIIIGVFTLLAVAIVSFRKNWPKWILEKGEDENI